MGGRGFNMLGNRLRQQPEGLPDLSSTLKLALAIILTGRRFPTKSPRRVKVTEMEGLGFPSSPTRSTPKKKLTMNRAEGEKPLRQDN